MASKRKSPKTQSRKRNDLKLPQYSMTKHALQIWYKSMFEKLGWMILAKAKDHEYKISCYKRSVKELIKHADPDRLHDINVIKMNAVFLDKFVTKHL